MSDTIVLHCEHCGAVRSVSPEQLDPVRATVKQLFGYEARFTHFAIVGLCPNCASQTEPRHTPAGHSHTHAHRRARLALARLLRPV